MLSCPMSSLPVEITHDSAVVKGDVSKKTSVPPPTHPQGRRTTEHVAGTFLVSQSCRTCPRGWAALDPSSLWLAPSLLRLTGRGCAAQLAQLPLACCKLESRITTARRRLLSSVPLSLKTVRCAAAAGRGPRVVFGLQIQPQGDACTGTLLFIFAAHKARMPSRAPPQHFPPFLPFFLPPPLLLLFPPLPAVHKVISEISGTIFFFHDRRNSTKKGISGSRNPKIRNWYKDLNVGW